MAWYDESVFYHIYPLGLTGAPKHNDYGEPVHRLQSLLPWISHLKKLGITKSTSFLDTGLSKGTYVYVVRSYRSENGKYVYSDVSEKIKVKIS